MNVREIFAFMQNPQVKKIMNSSNPRQELINFINNNPNCKASPMGKNVLSMLQRGNINEIEEYSDNLAQSQGINTNELKNSLNNFGK